MSNMKARAGLAILALFAALGLGACDNTIRGAATDLQQSGNAIEDSAAGNP